jgi:hypothetical protein
MTMDSNEAFDDGGQAFPVPGTDWNDRYPGMTLRQWYAGLAMQGVLASITTDENAMQLASSAKGENVTIPAYIARMALNADDALIAAEKATR